MGKSNCSVRHKSHQDFESHMDIRGERKQNNSLGHRTMWKHTQTFSFTLDCSSTATIQRKINIRWAYFFVRRAGHLETIWDECEGGSKKRKAACVLCLTKEQKLKSRNKYSSYTAPDLSVLALGAMCGFDRPSHTVKQRSDMDKRKILPTSLSCLRYDIPCTREADGCKSNIITFENISFLLEFQALSGAEVT